MALEQFGPRCKIGDHHAQVVDYFLDRATYPTYEKLAAHYPDHPRAGAPPLHPGSDFGVCVLNTFNVKRGYWKINDQNRTAKSAAASPSNISPGAGSGMESGGARASTVWPLCGMSDMASKSLSHAATEMADWDSPTEHPDLRPEQYVQMVRGICSSSSNPKQQGTLPVA